MDQNDLWLLKEFESRKNKNPSYSLRAYANHLGVSPSFLSKVFNGDKKVHYQMAEKILIKLDLNENDKEVILSKYLELHKKNNEVKERLKRILGEEKSKTVKYLGGQEFLSISSWEYTYVFYIIDLVPESVKEDMNKSLQFISDESRLEVKRVEEILQSLKNVGLIEIDGKLEKLYDRFLFRGRENEIDINDLRDSFIQSSLFLSQTGALSLRTEKKEGRRLERSNPQAKQMNLLNWDFFLVGENTAFAIEELIENFYSDIQKICQEDPLDDGRVVYCMSSQFFGMKTRIEK